MSSLIPKVGLKGAIFGSFTLALFLVLGALFILIPQAVESYLTDNLEFRGKAIIPKIKEQLPENLTEFDPSTSEKIDQIVEGRREVQFVAAVRTDGLVVAKTTGTDISRSTLERFFAQQHPVYMKVSDQTMVIADPIYRSPADREIVGYVLVGLDRSAVEAQLQDLRKLILGAFIFGFTLYLLLLYVISRLFILRPLEGMMAIASRISEADLTGHIEQTSDDELGALAEALNRIAQSLRDTLGRIRGVSEGVAQVIDQISRTGTVVSSGSNTIQARVQDTSELMSEMLASLRSIADNVEVLYQSAEESSSSIGQMTLTNEQVTQNVYTMASSVEETTSAIEQMTYAIRDVAKNVEALLASTEETSASMNRMDLSIGQVEMNANETARLSEQVSHDAEVGVLALRKTIGGIDKIKSSSLAAASVIESLGKRVEEIGAILNAIDDIAEQTNLLALNAAIIAAQAGEHGKGFGVVAEEIKELAERTGASTKEIAELIRRVQEESRNAAAAMNQGVRNVDQGVVLGHEAESALKKISESANKATNRVKAIASATVEQARGSKQVTMAMQRIAQTIEQISRATSEQAKGSEQIMKSAEHMKRITGHVQHSSQEQAQGSRQITRAIHNINERVTQLKQAQKDQTKGSEHVLKAVEAIKFVCEQQTRSVKQLESAIESLQQQAEVLRSEVRRFRV